MTVLQAHDVWRGDVGVLVCLVGVVGRDATLGRKRELGDNVADLVLGGLLLVFGLRRLIGSGTAPIVISSCWRAIVLLLSFLLQSQLLRVRLHALITLCMAAQTLAWDNALGAQLLCMACRHHLFVLLSTRWPRGHLLGNCFQRRALLLSVVPCLLTRINALTGNILKDVWALVLYTPPIASSRRGTVRLSALLSLGLLLLHLHEVVHDERVSSHRLLLVLAGRLLHHVHLVQRLVLAELTANSLMTILLAA